MVWPAIAAGAAVVGSQLFGGYQQKKAQKDANKQNLKIAREQMAFQEKHLLFYLKHLRRLFLQNFYLIRKSLLY